MVRLPSGVGTGLVLDEGTGCRAGRGFVLAARSGSAGTARNRRRRAYAGGIALFLRWGAGRGRTWEAGAGQLGLFMTWLAHAGRAVSGADAPAGAAVLAGPGDAGGALGTADQRGAGRCPRHDRARGRGRRAPGHLVQVLYEVADDRDLPAAARGEGSGTGWRMRARHRLHDRTRGWTGPVTAMWSPCWARAVRRATG